MSAVIFYIEYFPTCLMETLSSGKTSPFHHAKNLLSNFWIIFQPLGLRIPVSALLSPNATLPASHQALNSSLPLVPLPVVCWLSHRCVGYVKWTTALRHVRARRVEMHSISRQSCTQHFQKAKLTS